MQVPHYRSIGNVSAIPCQKKIDAVNRCHCNVDRVAQAVGPEHFGIISVDCCREMIRINADRRGNKATGSAVALIASKPVRQCRSETLLQVVLSCFRSTFARTALSCPASLQNTQARFLGFSRNSVRKSVVPVLPSLGAITCL